jgi:hypothetical protein
MASSSHPDKRTRIHLNRRVITFLVCLLISVFFWLLMTLSKEYSLTVRFPVQYINLPTDKVISNNLPEGIDIALKGKGFDLLSYKFRKKHGTVNIDVKDGRPMKYRDVYYLLSHSQLDKIRSQFSNEIHILWINPDTIFINFNKKVSRRVPVNYHMTLFFSKQFNLTDSVAIDPKYITVSGEESVINEIDSVETQHVTLGDISNSTTVRLPILKPAAFKHVEFSHSFVTATINVTKYTEASLELPVEVENLPLGYSFRTFPDKVTVKFNVAFENYEKINALNFRAVVDYKKIDEGSNKLKVQLVKVPQGIRNVKLVTEKVEYIISK